MRSAIGVHWSTSARSTTMPTSNHSSKQCMPELFLSVMIRRTVTSTEFSGALMPKRSAF